MSEPYKEIVKVLDEISNENGLHGNILKQVYDAEKEVVFMGTRKHIYNNLREIILKNAQNL